MDELKARVEQRLARAEATGKDWSARACRADRARLARHRSYYYDSTRLNACRVCGPQEPHWPCEELVRMADVYGVAP